MVDDTITPVLNRAARDWHQNYFAELVANAMTCVGAFLPGAGPAARQPSLGRLGSTLARWPASRDRYGLRHKNSSHCAFAPPFRDYIKKAYEEIVGLIEAAGLTAQLQFGEVLWWYLASGRQRPQHPPTQPLRQPAHGMESKPGSGLDTFLIEGFQFAAVDRNLDQIRWMAGHPFEVLS